MSSSLLQSYMRTVLLVLVAAVFFAGCVVQRSPITGQKRAYGYSWAEEIKIGQESDPQIVAQFGLYDDERLAAYVTRIGEAVLAESHLRRPDAAPEYRNTPFTFRVLDSPVVNAFALPGGYIYVTRGLLSHLNNEAQLAVVLGHEVTHVAARHASQRAATQQFGMIGLIGAAIGGQAILGGSAGENILDLGSTAAGLLFLQYGRDDERESDRNGVDYAARVGYKPGEASAFSPRSNGSARRAAAASRAFSRRILIRASASRPCWSFPPGGSNRVPRWWSRTPITACSAI